MCNDWKGESIWPRWCWWEGVGDGNYEGKKKCIYEKEWGVTIGKVEVMGKGKYIIEFKDWEKEEA